MAVGEAGGVLADVPVGVASDPVHASSKSVAPAKAAHNQAHRVSTPTLITHTGASLPLAGHPSSSPYNQALERGHATEVVEATTTQNRRPNNS